MAGRAEFASENPNVLSHLREDGDLLHLYLYHFLYETGEPAEVEVALPGRRQPRTGSTAGPGRSGPHLGVRQDGDRTIVTVTLAPGRDGAAHPRPVGRSPLRQSAPAGRETVAELPEWTIAVESWDAGEPELITEDRGLGYQTREVRPTTAVTRIDAGTGPLRPWKDLPEVGPEVSGVGEYTTTLHLDQRTAGRAPVPARPRLHRRWPRLRPGQRRRGRRASTPQRRSSTSPRTCTPGDNTVTVRVSSSLNNRLLARGYYDAGARHHDASWAATNRRCRPPRRTTTGCSVRSGSCRKRRAADPMPTR